MPDPIAVKTMFGRIAGRYDLANRVMSGGLDVYWRSRLVRRVARRHPRLVVDLATGSGDVAFALARRIPDTRILGLDFCEPMLEQARRRQGSMRGGDRIEFRFGDALDLPLDDGSVDVLTISFGLRNFADRARAIREMRRVLRPSGALVILEFSRPVRLLRPIYSFYLNHVLPRLAGWITGDRPAYDYLASSVGAWPDHRSLALEIEAEGFPVVEAVPMAFGIVALHEAESGAVAPR